jgi:hypothetical protein
MSPPEDLKVNSIGTCTRCGYHGPGPAHDCKSPQAGIEKLISAYSQKANRCEKQAIRAPTLAQKRALEEQGRHFDGVAKGLDMALKLLEKE